MKTKTFCDQVKESLVDLCEGTLSSNDERNIRAHLEACESCKKEFALTEKLLKLSDETIPGETYFEQLSERINEKILGPCERAQNFIANVFTEEAIPADVEKHLKECPDCKKEVAFVTKMVEEMHHLSVALPNEKFFQQQLFRIDTIIETLPTKRVARVESREIAGYFTGIFESFRSTLLQPYAALAVSAMVILLVVGARFYSSRESIEEKQINLSEVINNTRSVAEGNLENEFNVHQAKLITSPAEDERIQMRSTGSAKADKKDKNKKIN